MRPSLIAVLVALLCTMSCASRTEDKAAVTWLDSMEQAQAQAAQSNRPILALFTGSDWCPWCVKLQKEIFATKEFQDWAAKTVVLVKFDFLRRTAQPADVKKTHAALAQKYGIRGFPTVKLLNARGEALGSLGYQPGGPAAWTAAAQKVIGGK